MVRSIRSSYRVPGEDVGRAVERIKIILELVEHTFGDGFGRPAIGGVGAADRARLRKKENLVVAHHERSEEHTSELQSLMRISYAVFCLKKKKNKTKSNAQTIS